jgi:hypothetical protein
LTNNAIVLTNNAIVLAYNAIVLAYNAIVPTDNAIVSADNVNTKLKLWTAEGSLPVSAISQYAWVKKNSRLG